MADVDVKALAQRLRLMADKIDLNDATTFGGAFVIIPPPDGGEPLETLILDAKQDPAQFFILLKARIDNAIVLLDQSKNQGFAGRR